MFCNLCSAQLLISRNIGVNLKLSVVFESRLYGIINFDLKYAFAGFPCTALGIETKILLAECNGAKDCCVEPDLSAMAIGVYGR